MRTLLWISLLSSVALLGCGDDATGMGGSDLTPFTEAEVQEVFTNSCASGTGSGCHSQIDGEPTPGVATLGMNLDNFATNGLVIDVVSSEVPELTRIEPGSREDSYLWHKINGSQLTVGGMGSQMPLGRDPLDAETIERIGLYIDNL